MSKLGSLSTSVMELGEAIGKCRRARGFEEAWQTNVY